MEVNFKVSDMFSPPTVRQTTSCCQQDAVLQRHVCLQVATPHPDDNGL